MALIARTGFSLDLGLIPEIILNAVKLANSAWAPKLQKEKRKYTNNCLVGTKYAKALVINGSPAAGD